MGGAKELPQKGKGTGGELQLQRVVVVCGRAVWLLLRQVMEPGSEAALWWNRLAAWAFSGCDEAQKCLDGESVAVHSAFRATFRALETFTDN